MMVQTKARIVRGRSFSNMRSFAKEAGVSHFWWRLFESGRGGLPEDAVQKAAKTLGVPVAEIADERGFPVGV